MVSFIRRHRFFLVVFFAFLIEIAMLSFWRGTLGSHKSALVFFSASLIIGLMALRLSFLKSRSTNTFTYFPLRRRSNDTIPGMNYSGVFLTVIFCVIAYWTLSYLFNTNPVRLEESDIIPQTQILTQRFLKHEFPYQVIPFPGYDLFPTYQPLQWMPYAVAETADLDYRKLALLLLLLVFMVAVFYLFRNNLLSKQFVFLGVLPFLPMVAVAFYEPTIYVRTLENLIVGYYLILCLALVSRSVFFIGAALVCCLLSRYSIVFWVPLFLFMLYCSGERKKAGILVLLCVAGAVVFYLVPFFAKDSSIFTKGYQYHAKAALAEWQGQWWQKANEKPFQLFRGIGFAGMFYDYYKGSVEEKLKAFQLLHLLFSAGVCVGLGVFFYLVRHRVSLVVFALAGLKIYLCVFYHFIQIPYDYLYLTLIYISIPIVWLSIKPPIQNTVNLQK